MKNEPRQTCNVAGRVLLLRATSVAFLVIACILFCSCESEEAEPDSVWHDAIAAGDMETVETLLEEGHDPGALTEPGGKYGQATVEEPAAAIHLAAAMGRETVLERFLEAGAGSEIRDGRGYTPLHLAVLAGANDAVELLLERGAAVDVAASDGWTALTLAPVYDYDFIVEQLLLHGADVNQAHAKNGMTALMIAAGRGRLETVEHLLAHGANVNVETEDGFTAYLRAAAGDQVETMKQLAAAGADVHHVDDIGFDALTYAAAFNESAVKHLLEMGFDPNREVGKGNTAMHEAAEYGSASVILPLVEAGGDLHLPNDEGVTPLQILQARDDADAQDALEVLGE